LFLPLFGNCDLITRRVSNRKRHRKRSAIVSKRRTADLEGKSGSQPAMPRALTTQTLRDAEIMVVFYIASGLSAILRSTHTVRARAIQRPRALKELNFGALGSIRAGTLRMPSTSGEWCLVPNSLIHFSTLHSTGPARGTTCHGVSGADVSGEGGGPCISDLARQMVPSCPARTHCRAANLLILSRFVAAQTYHLDILLAFGTSRSVWEQALRCAYDFWCSIESCARGAFQGAGPCSGRGA
jgi:hypothetical protein